MTDPIQYEVLVKNLLEARLASEGLKDLRIQHNAHYVGKSGHGHQIDVAVEFLVAGVKIIVLVECKKYAQLVGIDEVMELAMRIEDIGAHKGILVTTKGFQKGAYKMAKSKAIALVLAVDFELNVGLESPSREKSLARSFAAKAERVVGPSAKDFLSALYPYSLEAKRYSPLEFGELERQKGGSVRGRGGYVIAEEDCSVDDVVGLALDTTPYFCVVREGLLLAVALECGAKIAL